MVLAPRAPSSTLTWSASAAPAPTAAVAETAAQVDYIDHAPFHFPSYCKDHQHRVNLNEMPYVQEGVH